MSNFEWQQYLDLAERLEKESDEASKRTAISRAYYAIYGEACALCPNENDSGGGIHSKYWRQWQHAGGARQKIAYEALRLLKKRTDADYEQELHGSIDVIAKSSLTMARGLLEQIKKNLS